MLTLTWHLPQIESVRSTGGPGLDSYIVTTFAATGNAAEDRIARSAIARLSRAPPNPEGEVDGASASLTMDALSASSSSAAAAMCGYEIPIELAAVCQCLTRVPVTVSRASCRGASFFLLVFRFLSRSFLYFFLQCACLRLNSFVFRCTSVACTRYACTSPQALALSLLISSPSPPQPLHRPPPPSHVTHQPPPPQTRVRIRLLPPSPCGSLPSTLLLPCVRQEGT
jgi:hypothetical protein